jgi:D-alanyl-D-alanine carboxypeptidase
LVPASNQKLPVTAAALIMLGADFRFRTAVFAGGAVSDKGLVQGPLLVTGTADPTADGDIFASMLTELRKRGVNGCWDVWVSGAVTGSKGDSPEASQSRLAQVFGKAGFLTKPQVSVSKVAAQTTLLIEHLSEPLGRIIVNINKRSLNSWADNLWRALAWLVVGSIEQVPGFLYQFWRERGVDMAEVCFADGSGLSRRNRATASFYVSLLRYMYHCPTEWPAFVGSLPVAGRDGTLARRMTNGPATGRVWAKTGTMHDMACLSGYAETLNGRLLAFSMLMNDLTCPPESARYLQDLACDLMVQFEGDEQSAWVR